MSDIGRATCYGIRCLNFVLTLPLSQTAGTTRSCTERYERGRTPAPARSEFVRCASSTLSPNVAARRMEDRRRHSLGMYSSSLLLLRLPQSLYQYSRMAAGPKRAQVDCHWSSLAPVPGVASRNVGNAPNAS